MAVSNNRFKDPDSVHHLVSRIAHRVYFLKDEECNEFVEIMCRAAEFCGIKLIGWCIMTNHFHILAYLPFPEEIDNDEVLRRYGVLKGRDALDNFINWIYCESAKGKEGEDRVKESFDKLRDRMYDIGEFMKIVKQWFTQEYNRRYSHVGTLWESAYYDKPIPMEHEKLVRVLSYIHLNPIRAAVCSGFDDYAWSSLSAAVKHVSLAIAGLRFVYGEEDSIEDIIATHHAIMSDCLEAYKRKRAEEIARKRAAGYNIPADSLTDEAYVSQAAAHLEKVIESGVEIAQERLQYKRNVEEREEFERRIIKLIINKPQIEATELAKETNLKPTTVYKYLRALQSRGILKKAKRGAPWTISEFHVRV